MNTSNRREFLNACSVAAAASAPLAAAAKGEILTSFSTLGCPKWDWPTIVNNAAQWGFAGIELRGLQGEMDLTKRPEFQKDRWKESRQLLQDKKLKVIGLGASARMHEADSTARAKQLDEGRRFIDLAHQMKSPYVRVFGDKYIAGESKDATIARIVNGLSQLGLYAKSAGVTVLLESHGDFNDSATLLKILQQVDLKSVALLWDAHHTCVVGKEKPAATFQALKAYIRHVHLKDSHAVGDKREYVLLGEGDVPVKETVQALKNGGYKGFYNLEWEKAWAPLIAEPEVAFPQFAKKIREYYAAV